MASLSSVSSSSNTVSSLMNSANMISGLASGLDTESMIESLVQSYQTKIDQLNQKVTKVEWKQEAYRSIISKMYNFSQKYTSYTSSTNLMSPSFFSSAVKVLTKGDYADSVTASGKTSSDIQLNAVHQLAKAAQYRTSSNIDVGDAKTIESSKGVDLSFGAPTGADNGGVTLSNLSGSLKLTYGSKTVSISFNELTDVDAIKDARTKLEANSDGKEVSESEVLAELINQKLANQTITFTNGSSESASERIQAVANEDGSIEFKELGNAKNGVSISGATGNLMEQFGLDEDALKEAKDNKEAVTTMKLSDSLKNVGEDGTGGLTRDLNTLQYLAEKGTVGMNMTLDGTTKQIVMPTVGYKEETKTETDEDGNETQTTVGTYYINGEEVAVEDFANKYADALNKSVQEAFGDKVKVTNENDDGTLKLKFELKNEGSQLVLNSDIGNALGIGNVATSYLNTSKTLKDLGFELSDDYAVKNEDGSLALDDKGKKQYDFTINGVKVGSYTEDTKLSEIINDINSNKEAGVQVAYSQTTQSFTFTARETGADSKVEFGNDLAAAMFQRDDAKVTNGQDSVFTATINGEEMTMTRSTNSVDIDGLTINMEDTFNSKTADDGSFAVDNTSKAVTFQSKTDSDKIIDAIKSMVDDYNTMMSEIKSAYSTMPYQNSSGAFANYEPLTEDDRAGMTESAIERYEEKAKQGILFGDRNLSNLYTKMSQVFSFTSQEDVDALKNMGITVGFSISDGTQAVQVDEEKLRAMLDSDPDTVANLFTKSDGIMDRMKTQLDIYAKTTGDPKGILVEQSGTPLASLSLMSNQWQKEIDNYNTQIESWQDKLASQVERYTSQFTRLELLIQQMNSQSSTLAGMMGG